jgi:hypothetical protein
VKSGIQACAGWHRHRNFNVAARDGMGDRSAGEGLRSTVKCKTVRLVQCRYRYCSMEGQHQKLHQIRHRSQCLSWSVCTCGCIRDRIDEQHIFATTGTGTARTGGSAHTIPGTGTHDYTGYRYTWARVARGSLLKKQPYSTGIDIGSSHIHHLVLGNLTSLKKTRLNDGICPMECAMF